MKFKEGDGPKQRKMIHVEPQGLGDKSFVVCCDITSTPPYGLRSVTIKCIPCSSSHLVHNWNQSIWIIGVLRYFGLGMILNKKMCQFRALTRFDFFD